MPYSLSILTLLLALINQTRQAPSMTYPWPAKLSEWNLFHDPMHELRPADGVIPYTVNAPLYSDYAYKARFVKMPAGMSASFHPTEPFTMPDGTVLIKNFYYPVDERHPDRQKQILETRLLVRDRGEWHAMTYRWNAEQTEAVRAVAGGSADVTWTDHEGKINALRYLIPDVNQCKNCHNRENKMLPLGIKTGQLNRPEKDNQLIAWAAAGLLEGLPQDLSGIARYPDYESGSENVDSRARSYLEANCGHCHSPWGSARTSGLHLNFEETYPHALGVMKSPVAAGRGSGGLHYSIVPGKPQKSILLYRMQSNDPGIRMPEINRQLAHEEGIRLIREWIEGMDDE